MKLNISKEWLERNLEDDDESGLAYCPECLSNIINSWGKLFGEDYHKESELWDSTTSDGLN